MGLFHLRLVAAMMISDAAASKAVYLLPEESRHIQMLSAPAMTSATQLTSIGI
jgi:hypothetical protein